MQRSSGEERQERLIERIPRTTVALLVGVAIWLPCLSGFFWPDERRDLGVGAPSAKARALAERHLRLWADDRALQQQIEQMRASNPEWDFMGRTFLVLALCNMALREPERRDAYLDVIDRIVQSTLEKEREGGQFVFLMDYAKSTDFVMQPPRSIFIDGELALMIAARRVVAEKLEYRRLLAERLATMMARMGQSPTLCAESCPDECWTFCNAIAIAAMRIADYLDGTDHTDFIAAWLARVKRTLIDSETGMLISAFRLDGRALNGPEGSSIWMVAHCLRLVDPVFARTQYDLAKQELARDLLGFGYAREWPESRPGQRDVDSGPIIPFLEASPGSSGLALLGAASFDDQAYFAKLIASLDFAAFPLEEDGALRYAASNQLGDAVILYALVEGPLWDTVIKEQRR